MNQRYTSSAVIPDGQVGADEWKRDQELFLQATSRPDAKIPPRLSHRQAWQSHLYTRRHWKGEVLARDGPIRWCVGQSG
jgi:hypothetical protein